MLQHAQALLSHTIPSGDVAAVFHRALKAGARLSASRGSVAPRATPSSSTISTRWRVAVKPLWSTRLRCRGHNQCEAERIFGAGFMNEKRRTRAKPHKQAEAPEAEPRKPLAEVEERSRTIRKDYARDVMTCLRERGFRSGEARGAIEFCETIPNATLAERVRAALKYLCPKTRGMSLEART
jgi:hypothetical protein